MQLLGFICLSSIELYLKNYNVEIKQRLLTWIKFDDKLRCLSSENAVRATAGNSVIKFSAKFNNCKLSAPWKTSLLSFANLLWVSFNDSSFRKPTKLPPSITVIKFLLRSICSRRCWLINDPCFMFPEI